MLEVLTASGATTATELSRRFPMSRQAISKHLQVLVDARLVTPARQGRETHWAATAENLSPAIEWMASVGGSFDDRLAALQHHLHERQADRGFGARPPLRIAASRRPPRPEPPRRVPPPLLPFEQL